jgi:hypothetical protein
MLSIEEQLVVREVVVGLDGQDQVAQQVTVEQ